MVTFSEDIPIHVESGVVSSINDLDSVREEADIAKYKFLLEAFDGNKSLIEINETA